jgi:hypothetical protein
MRQKEKQSLWRNSLVRPRRLRCPHESVTPTLTSLKEKLIKSGAKVVCHGRYVAFQMAAVAIPRNLFSYIPRLNAELRPPAVTSKVRSARFVMPSTPWKRWITMAENTTFSATARSRSAHPRPQAAVALWACQKRPVRSDWQGTGGYLGNVFLPLGEQGCSCRARPPGTHRR